MKTIEITVKDKIATAADGAVYVCGNSDYVVDFHFDGEWDAYDTKTARFICDGTYQDQVFQGTQCPVPVIVGTRSITVGVFAGNICTTTPAYISARRSILCDCSVPADPAPDVYAQIMELIQGLGEPDPETIAAAVAEYIRKNPISETDPTVPAWAKAAEKPAYTAAEVGAISQEDLQAATDAALSQAKERGLFDGEPGKDGVDGKDGQPGADGSDGKDGADGYTPVKGTDYFTEADKQEIASAAAEIVPIPDVLPNPNALTFTGAATGTYDGSAPLSVEIPSGGSGGGGSDNPLRLVRSLTLEENTDSVNINTDDDGNAFSLSECYLYINAKVTSNSKIIYLPNGHWVAGTYMTSANQATTDYAYGFLCHCFGDANKFFGYEVYGKGASGSGYDVRPIKEGYLSTIKSFKVNAPFASGAQFLLYGRDA